MTDACTPTLVRITTLQRLHLDTRAVGDTGLQALSAATTLTYLDLFGAKVTDRGCVYLRCTRPPCLLASMLYPLWHPAALARSVLHAPGAPADLRWPARSQLTGLQSLEMCGGAISDAGVVHLAPLGQLTHLSLAHNTRVTDASLPVFQGMSELVFLNLTRSRLTGPGIQRLACLSVRPRSCLPSLLGCMLTAADAPCACHQIPVRIEMHRVSCDLGACFV